MFKPLDSFSNNNALYEAGENTIAGDSNTIANIAGNGTTTFGTGNQSVTVNYAGSKLAGTGAKSYHSAPLTTDTKAADIPKLSQEVVHKTTYIDQRSYTTNITQIQKNGLGWFHVNWKAIAIVAAGAALIAAIAALIKALNNSIKVRFNKTARVLQRMQKDFALNPKGMDMTAVLPGVGSIWNDKLKYRHFGKKKKLGINDETGAMGLYPFVDSFLGEIKADYVLAQKSMNAVIAANKNAETSPEVKADENNPMDASVHAQSHNPNNVSTSYSPDKKVYSSFTELFRSQPLLEGYGKPLNEMATAAMISLGITAGSLIVRGGMMIWRKYKDGKPGQPEDHTVQVTKQSTREVAYGILYLFADKYVSMEALSKRCGIDVENLQDINAGNVEKMKKAIESFKNPDTTGGSKQFNRIRTAYDKMLGHYMKIGNKIIENFKTYTKTDFKSDAKKEKHENLLVGAYEKLSALWEKQGDIFKNNFSHILVEITSNDIYISYLDFITNVVMPVFKTGTAGDMDFLLDAMPKKDDFFVIRQTMNQAEIDSATTAAGNVVVCQIMKDFAAKKNDKKQEVTLRMVGLLKDSNSYVIGANGNAHVNRNQLDLKRFSDRQYTIPYNKFLSLDPHMVEDPQDFIKDHPVLDKDRGQHVVVDTNVLRGAKGGQIVNDSPGAYVIQIQNCTADNITVSPVASIDGLDDLKNILKDGLVDLTKIPDQIRALEEKSAERDAKITMTLQELINAINKGKAVEVVYNSEIPGVKGTGPNDGNVKPKTSPIFMANTKGEDQNYIKHNCIYATNVMPTTEIEGGIPFAETENLNEKTATVHDSGTGEVRTEERSNDTDQNSGNAEQSTGNDSNTDNGKNAASAADSPENTNVSKNADKNQYKYLIYAGYFSEKGQIGAATGDDIKNVFLSCEIDTPFTDDEFNAIIATKFKRFRSQDGNKKLGERVTGLVSDYFGNTENSKNWKKEYSNIADAADAILALLKGKMPKDKTQDTATESNKAFEILARGAACGIGAATTPDGSPHWNKLAAISDNLVKLNNDGHTFTITAPWIQIKKGNTVDELRYNLILPEQVPEEAVNQLGAMGGKFEVRCRIYPAFEGGAAMEEDVFATFYNQSADIQEFLKVNATVIQTSFTNIYDKLYKAQKQGGYTLEFNEAGLLKDYSQLRPSSAETKEKKQKGNGEQQQETTPDENGTGNATTRKKNGKTTGVTALDSTGKGTSALKPEEQDELRELSAVEKDASDEFTENMHSSFKITYNVDSNINEALTYNKITLTRNLNESAKGYMILSDTLWGDGTYLDAKKQLTENMKTLLMNNRTYSKLAARVKNSKTLMMHECNAGKETYSVALPYNRYGLLTDGCPLYESVLLLRFNNNGILTDACNMGIYKITAK